MDKGKKGVRYKQRKRKRDKLQKERRKEG